MGISDPGAKAEACICLVKKKYEQYKGTQDLCRILGRMASRGDKIRRYISLLSQGSGIWVFFENMQDCYKKLEVELNSK